MTAPQPLFDVESGPPPDETALLDWLTAAENGGATVVRIAHVRARLATAVAIPTPDQPSTDTDDWQLEVFVPGRPAPQGSIRAIVHRSTGRAVAIKDNNATQKSWRADVRDAVAAAWGDRGPIDGPVAIRIDFVMPRPASTPKRRTPPAIRKPDGDKLERAVWDALTHVVWVDDARVVEWAGSKRLAETGETPGAHIRIRVLP